jgi:iron complex outermembrane receptor protein
VRNRYRLKRIYLLLLPAYAVHAVAQESRESLPVTTIFGQGQTRQVQDITRDDLVEALPGTSPLKTLEKLPGVSFQSADSFGAYEWSLRFGVRGFNQSQLGFTLDNVPLGDMSYANNNGLHISRAISPENIQRVSLSQGAGAVGTASTSNLGGTVQFYSIDPSDTLGATAAQTFGGYSTYRTFLRFDTGLLPSGTKAYVSATRKRAEKWKGTGPQDQDQVNTKLVQVFGQNKLSAFYNYSDRSENDYMDLSLDSRNRLGWDWDYYAPDWDRAVNAAGKDAVGGVTNRDDAYYLGRGLRKDNLAGATLDAKLAESINLKTTLYRHSNRGQGHWYTPYAPSSPTVPISIRTTEYSIGRHGVIGDLTWDLGRHTINAGFWAERNLHNVTRNFYAVTGPDDTNRFLSNPTSTDFKQDFTTTTTQFYLQDTLMVLDDKMKLNFGFKSPRVHIDAATPIGNRAAGSITAKKTFLPQVGVTYYLTKNDEVFSSVSRNMRAFQPGLDGPFSQTQTAFNLSSGNIRPETSTTVDLGYRFTRQNLTGSLAIYHTDFKDRQLTVATCTGILGCPNTLVNVGNVKTNGVEAAAVWTMARNWSWFNSFTYNNSQYKSNYLDGPNVVAANGKQVVDSPRRMFSTEVSFENESWFTRVGGKYTDKRYYTYLNDGQVPGYWLMNLSAGYKQKSFAGLKDVSIQFNVNNLSDKRYFSTVGSNGFVTSDPSGTFPTLLRGAPRQFFVTISGRI